jgi:hypothetical protein
VNILNKIVVSLLLLAAMILIPLVLIFPDQAEFALRYAADVVLANLTWLDAQATGAKIGIRLLLALGGLLGFLVCLILLVIEIVPLRRKTVSLQDKSGELMVDSIDRHLTYHLDLLPDVLRARPKISSRGRAVRATIYIETPPDVNVPQKSAEVQETARQVLEEQLGLQTKEIRVVIRPVDYPKLSTSERKRPMRAERPITPPLTPVEPMVEDQEAEPLLPRQEERPSLDDGSWPPAQPEQLEVVPPHIPDQVLEEPEPIEASETEPPGPPIYKADASELITKTPDLDDPSLEDADTDESPLEPVG